MKNPTYINHKAEDRSQILLLRTEIWRPARTAFTLVELIIVVSILGILAAIVLPEFQGHVQRAKESAAKDNLRILRETIERYAIDHNGIPPGYPGNDRTSDPDYLVFRVQLKQNAYLSDFPVNPFNDQEGIYVFNNNQSMDENTVAENVTTALYGWVYQPATKTIKLHWPGTDSEGKKYFDY